MEDTAFGMSAFFAEGVALGVVFVLVEVGAPSNEFINRLGCFCNDDLDRLLMAKSAAGIEGVCDMLFAGVTGVAKSGRQDGGDAALSPSGVGFEELAFGDDGDATVLGGFDGKGEAGDAGADDEEV